MLRKSIHVLSIFAFVLSLITINIKTVIADTITPAYNNIPSPLPPNKPSQGFECCQTQEIGDQIRLGGTDRKAESAIIMMSNWAAGLTYPTLLAANPNGYMHPITLNIYQVGTAPNVGTKIASVTQSFLIPWLPQNDPTCPFQEGSSTVRKWRGSDGNCYNGYAFTIKFDLTGIILPDEFIFGVAYNTQNYGYAPLGVSGPYNSLNVATSSLAPTIGTDVEPDAVYWNTSTASYYTDGGTAGVNIFRRDTGWTDYAIAATFNVLVPSTPVPPPDYSLQQINTAQLHLAVLNLQTNVNVVPTGASATNTKTYDIVLVAQNISPIAAPAVLASLKVPAGMTVSSVKWEKEGQYYIDSNLPRTCSFDGLTVYCGIGQLWSGMKMKITMRVTANPGTYQLGVYVEDLSTLYEVPNNNYANIMLNLN